MTKQSNKRKFLATTLTATMVAAAVAPVAGAAAADTKTFPDVPADHPYAGVIADMVNAEVIKGQPDGNFNIHGLMTRAEAAIMVANLLDLPVAPATNTTDFEDVKDNAWYTGAINSLKAEGIIAGKTATTFAPNAEITRAELSLILVEAYGLQDKNIDDVELPFTDVKEDVWYTDAIKILHSEGLIKGIDAAQTKFAPNDNMKRGDFAWLAANVDYAHGNKLPKPEAVAPQIKSVTAVNAKQAEVTFNGVVPAGVDFSNFEIDGGLVVTEAKISGNKAIITVNQDFVRNQEYTVTATGIEDADGKVYPDTKGTFTWAVQEGVTVALESTTIEQGEVIGLTVKDAEGKDIKDAKVKAVSFNTNILTSNTSQDAADKAPSAVKLTAKNLAGTVDVEVTTVLPDESILTNTFKVTVKDEVVKVSDSGFAFLTEDISDVETTDEDNFAYANTAAFNAYATPKTTLVVGESNEFHAFAETNGNPDTAEIDWADAKNPATSVKTSSSIVGTAVLENGVITVTGHAAGKTTLTVTFKDGTKKTFNIEVTAKPVFKDIAVDQTSVKLSDESKDDDGSGVEGVNLAEVEVYTLDQFDKKRSIDFAPENSKVTLSSSTDGIEVSALAADGKFTIKAKEDTPVKNAKVTVSYFAKDTDTKPTSTKTIVVNVTDVDATVDASDLDILVTSTEIDANAKNTLKAVDTIDYAAFDAFLLDSKGNRIGTSTVDAAELVTVADENVAIEESTKISFVEDAAHAQTYLRSADTVTVKVTDGKISKNLKVGYKNSAIIPNAATVATNAVSVKLKEGVTDLTLDELLFGKVDVDLDGQLVLDDVVDTDGVAIAVKKNAKNAGYVYNKPLVSLKGTNGDAILPTGAALYGSTTAELENGNLWSNSFVNNVLLEQGFEAEGFDVDFAISNVVSSADGATLDEDTGNVTAPAGESVTFTLVIKGIYIEDAIDLDDTTDKEKAKNNLLAKPVQLNVSVEGAN